MMVFMADSAERWCLNLKTESVNRMCSVGDVFHITVAMNVILMKWM